MTHILDKTEIADAAAAIGRSETQTMLLDAESLRRFHLAIGGDGDVSNRPPVMAHWAWFLPGPRDNEIGADGHARRGGFLPALPSLPRRMFASTRVQFDVPLVLNEVATLTTSITDVVHKSGRSGDLVFVTVERTVEQAGKSALSETQTLVYRGASKEALPQPKLANDAAEVPDDGRVYTPGPVNLFRFSAVTFNSHRIHYDRPYATGGEGYPGLVVHGPLLASLLAELAAQRGELSHFSFRAAAPCFVDQPVRLVPAGEDAFHAVRCDGEVATIAEVTYR